jgi:hypothetical protein
MARMTLISLWERNCYKVKFMKLIIAIIFSLIGSILVGSSISELGFIGNGLMKLVGAI